MKNTGTIRRNRTIKSNNKAKRKGNSRIKSTCKGKQMISYYELLGMIKEGKAPNKIKAHLNSQPKIYVREDDLDDTFSYYGLEEEEKEDSDYHYYLAECFLESSMFVNTSLSCPNNPIVCPLYRDISSTTSIIQFAILGKSEVTSI